MDLSEDNSEAIINTDLIREHIVGIRFKKQPT